MDETFNYLTLIGVCLLGAMSPGPSLLVILGVAGEHGTRAGIISSWSHATGVGFWAALSVSAWYFVVDTASVVSQNLITFISVAASLYLFYLSFVMLKESVFSREDNIDFGNQSKIHINDMQERQVEENSHTKALKAGLSISLANPKLLLFFSAIYPQVLPQGLTEIELIWAMLIPFIIDGFWYHIITVFSDRFGLLKALQKYKVWTQVGMAGLFIFIGLSSILKYL